MWRRSNRSFGRTASRTHAERARLRALTLAAGALALAAGCTVSGPAAGADDAVILMYHHVDASTPDATSVTPERFREHMRHLERNGFNVAPLIDVLRTIEAGEALPEKTVVLTFDDGYESVLDAALPVLERRGWPFTVFVNTDAIDEQYQGYLSWDELRRLASAGATIGNHTESHAHLVRRREGESERDWARRVRDEIEGAGERLEAEVGDAYVPALAYPYGEFDAAVLEIVDELNLFGLGQHSGAVGASTNLLAAPRFPQATGFAALEDFAQRVRSRALPARYAAEPARMLDGPGARPALELELGAGDYRASQLSCFASGQGRIEVEWLDEAERRVRVVANEPLNAGRTKYNCTAPSASETGVFYWFSHLFMVPRADGSWYEG